MIAFSGIDRRRGTGRRRRAKLKLPQVRRSILDPLLETEPWIDHCPCAEMLVLFVHNHPVAMIPGTLLDCFSLNTRLNQLRHRWPRRA
jgi:hypothetical protein